MQYPPTQCPIHNAIGYTSQLKAFKHRVIWICILASNYTCQINLVEDSRKVPENCTEEQYFFGPFHHWLLEILVLMQINIGSKCPFSVFFIYNHQYRWWTWKSQHYFHTLYVYSCVSTRTAMLNQGQIPCMCTYTKIILILKSEVSKVKYQVKE